jgi:hypothetical protein
MKPLLAKDIAAFVQRFNSFKDGEFRSIEILSPTQIKVTLAGQDDARSFDWIGLEIEFSGVSDAQLIENSKLSFINMSDGISMLSQNGVIGFCIGEYSSLLQVKDSALYLICTSLKYKEAAF